MHLCLSRQDGTAVKPLKQSVTRKNNPETQSITQRLGSGICPIYRVLNEHMLLTRKLYSGPMDG